MGLIVVLQGHGDDVDADDEGDDEVQVVVGAQRVDHQPDFAVAAVVGQLLGLWQRKGDRRRPRQSSSLLKLHETS